MEVNLYLVPELSTDVMRGNTYLIQYIGVNVLMLKEVSVTDLLSVRQLQLTNI